MSAFIKNTHYNQYNKLCQLIYYILYIIERGSSGFVQCRSADLAVSVGDRVQESANGAVDLVIRKLRAILLHLHLLLLRGLLGVLLFDHRLWRGISIAVHPEERPWVFDIVLDVELVLDVSKRQVGIGLCEEVLFFALIDKHA